jgi:uncharacterized cupredoxin-like copper-binding protein
MQRLVVLIPVALVLSACGGNSSSNTSKPAAVVSRTIQISEKEFSLTPARVSVSGPGTYAFKAANNGTTAHALEIEGNGLEQKSSQIQPGSTATLQVTFSKGGSYEMYCPIDGHKQQGMKGTVVVGNAASSGGNTTTGQTTTSSSPGY